MTFYVQKGTRKSIQDQYLRLYAQIAMVNGWAAAAPPTLRPTPPLESATEPSHKTASGKGMTCLRTYTDLVYQTHQYYMWSDLREKDIPPGTLSSDIPPPRTFLPPGQLPLLFRV